MVDINTLALVETQARKIDKYKSYPTFIDVISPEMILDLNKYLYLFCSEDVDAKIHTKVELISSDNYFAFTKTTLQNSDNSQYQFFTEELEIKVSHYGKQFIPFRLEFYKIIPEV